MESEPLKVKVWRIRVRFRDFCYKILRIMKVMRGSYAVFAFNRILAGLWTESDREYPTSKAGGDRY
jgi:hypothetical protein